LRPPRAAAPAAGLAAAGGAGPEPPLSAKSPPERLSVFAKRPGDLRVRERLRGGSGAASAFGGGLITTAPAMMSCGRTFFILPTSSWYFAWRSSSCSGRGKPVKTRLSVGQSQEFRTECD
jgi:hypothetical protein